MKFYTTADVLDGFHSIPVHRTLIIMTAFLCATALITAWAVSRNIPKLVSKQTVFVVQNHATKGGGVIIVDSSLDTVTLCQPEYVDTMRRFSLVCDTPKTLTPIPIDFSDQALDPDQYVEQ